MQDFGLVTSPTLLGRLRVSPHDPDAWQCFVDRYSPLLVRWCRDWGLQSSDIEDISQEVLTKLIQVMANFQYDPALRFRAWMRMVTRNAIRDFLIARKRREVREQSAATVVMILEKYEARSDLCCRLEDEYDLELLEEAQLRTRLRVKPTTWESFRLKEIEGLPVNRVSAQLGLSLAQVYENSLRVLKHLKQEVRRLERHP